MSTPGELSRCATVSPGSEVFTSTVKYTVSQPFPQEKTTRPKKTGASNFTAGLKKFFMSAIN